MLGGRAARLRGFHQEGQEGHHVRRLRRGQFVPHPLQLVVQAWGLVWACQYKSLRPPLDRTMLRELIWLFQILEWAVPVRVDFSQKSQRAVECSRGGVGI